MVIAGTVHRRFVALVLAGSMLFTLRPASAQPVVDQVLSDAQIAVQGGCVLLKVKFNIRIRYASHFPLDRGEELRITLNVVDRSLAAALATLKQEAATVPDNKLAGIRSIYFEPRFATGPALRILFDRPVAYQVAPDPDTVSMVVAIAGAKPSPTCRPIFPVTPYVAPGDNTRSASATGRPKYRSAGTVPESDLRAIAASMDEGRAALRHNNPGAAIQLFTKVLKYPENQYSAEAQEMLGLARQKNGQLGEARAEYEDYLVRYPSGEQSDRVRQRLAGIVTANSEPSKPLYTPNVPPGGMPPIGRFAPTNETNWALVGSASAFYIRDDSFRAVRDPTVAPDPNADPDSHRVHQNEMLSSLDLAATWNNDQTKGRIRFSGSDEFRFDSDANLAGIAALSVDTLVKDWNLRTVVGRQTLNTDGVLGRFDGTLFSWQALPMVRFDLVGGSPALSRFDEPFKNDKFFYGASTALGPFLGFETTLYAIEQRDRWLVDRESVGSEFRYFDESRYVFGTVDYDVLFERLNAAIFSGSWTLPDKSTIYGGADYRRTPFLSTWNALINQPFATLYDMLKAQTNGLLTNDQLLCARDLTQCALAQTPVFKSAMLGASHPLSDHWQVSADATVANLTQPISPIGLDPSLASLPAGNEWYYSTQLIGSNLIKDGDMYIAALRYSQLTNSNRFVVDLNTRYPLTNDLRISPRLRVGYAMGTGIDLKEYTVLPSFLVDYYWTKDLNLEFEVGAQWTSTAQNGIKSHDTELLATIGLRYSFYPDTSTKGADDKSKCGTPAATALCRYSPRPDGGNCASPPPGCR
jgi:hypothetical protein